MDLTTQTLIYAGSRFFHLAAAFVAVGGSFMLRYAVLPAVEELEQPHLRLDLHARMRRRLQVIVPAALALLLASGCVNIIRAFTVAPMPPPTYHMLLGIKLLIAFAMFGVALGLVWPSVPPNAVQRNRRRWLSFNVHAGLLLIAISVGLRFFAGK